MKTCWDNHYCLTKMSKIFIALSVLLTKIWFWYCQKRNLEDYESLHRLHNNVTCNMSQTYKYRNHPQSLLSHASSSRKWYHWILPVPTNLVIFYLSQKSAFMVPKYILQSVVYFSGQSCARHYAKPTKSSIFGFYS